MDLVNEEIVIAGISGRLSDCVNLNEFWKKLMRQTKCDEKIQNDSQKEVNGTIYGIDLEVRTDKFQQLCAVSCEAILDSGFNPATLYGQNIGVFIGTSSTAQETSAQSLSTRISALYGFRGPTYCENTDQLASLSPMHHGIVALLNHDCDGAIIGVISNSSVIGAALSHQVIVIFMQKSGIAKRSYLKIQASIANASQEMFSTSELSKFLNEAYNDRTNTAQSKLFCIATSHSDYAKNVEFIKEIDIIIQLLGKNPVRKAPLLIEVPSTEFSNCNLNGFSSILTIILSLQNKIIPGNKDLRNMSTILTDTNIKMVTEKTSLKFQDNESHYFGINSIGQDGSVIHLVLKQNENFNHSIVPNVLALPALVPFSGQAHDQVQASLELIKSQERNIEFETLMREIAQDISINQHSVRGFILKSKSEPVIAIYESLPGPRRPLWFIFSGMGTLWHGMMDDLMRFEIFAKSIYKATEIMKPLGIDLTDILLNGDDELLDRYMGVCFIAVGVALTDLLIALDLKPDGYLGHSGGEILCAYLDGCITQEEALISYYYKDECVVQYCQDGAMASISLSWEKAIAKCPPWIYPACHNSGTNVTISGPSKDVTKFLTKLKSEDNISGSLVNTNGVAYHTRYLKPMWPTYETHVKQVVKSSKTPSKKWLSTSIPEKSWSSTVYQGMADYLLFNMKNPVLFYPVLKHIPNDAVVLEISANSFLTSSLEKSLPKTCSIFGLIRKHNGNNAVQFLNSVGKLYQYGIDVKMNHIYPKLHYPLDGIEMPLISPLVHVDIG